MIEYPRYRHVLKHQPVQIKKAIKKAMAVKAPEKEPVRKNKQGGKANNTANVLVKPTE